MTSAPILRCCVVHALPGDEFVLQLELPPGATVGMALAEARSRCARLETARVAAIDWTGPVGVFGERCGPDRPLEPGDRIEIYRALRSDPRESRRRRARQTRGPAQR